ncbi:MAG: hypothetical protein R3A47_05850 [Polyangiales bacterium]
MSLFPEPKPNEYILDRSELPIVKLTYPEVASIEVIDRSLAEFTEIAKVTRFVALIDARGLKVRSTTPELRRYYFEKKKIHDEGAVKDRLLGEAIILYPIHRPIFQVYRWMVGSEDYPVGAFSRYDEAHAWCKDIVAQHMR